MQIPDDGRAFLTLRDLVEIGYGTQASVYRDLHAGLLPAMKVGKARYIIPKDEFIALLESKRMNVVREAADGEPEAVM